VEVFKEVILDFEKVEFIGQGFVKFRLIPKRAFA